MSLISDALTKARQEAARQDAQRPRLPYAVGAADSPSRRRSLLPVLAGLGAGGLMAALLLVLAWSAGWGLFARPAHQAAVAQAAPATPPSPVKPSAPPEATPETARTAPPQPAAPVQETRPQPPVETRPAPPVDAPAARPAPVTTAPAEPAPSPPLPTTPVATAPAPQAPAQPTAAAPSQGAAGLADGKSYAGEVPVPGGGAVKLNGIAFSRDHPIAVLDGRVVERGEIVQGFTVVAIEAGRVKLQGYGATVFVSPR